MSVGFDLYHITILLGSGILGSCEQYHAGILYIGTLEVAMLVLFRCLVEWVPFSDSMKIVSSFLHVTATVAYGGASMIKTVIQKHGDKPLQLNKCPGATRGSVQPHAQRARFPELSHRVMAPLCDSSDTCAEIE